MPNAKTHEQANAGAQTADDMLRDVERQKHAVAVPDTSDIFARTAREAKRSGFGKTDGTRTNEG